MTKEKATIRWLDNIKKNEVEKANLINNISVALIAKVAEEVDALLIHISTDYVFDGKSKNPYIENSNTNPISIYGSTKLQGEKSIISSGCKYYIIRTSWLYSKNFGRNFYRNILSEASIGNEIEVVKDQYGTPTNTEKVADFIIKIIVSLPKKGIYHCAGEEIMSWYDFANKIVNENNYPNKIIPINSNYGVVKRPSYSPLKNTDI